MQSRLPDETPGEMKRRSAKEGGMKGKIHTYRRRRRRKTRVGNVEKNNEAKSEDKRGAISVAGFMYCQHYPRY